MTPQLPSLELIESNHQFPGQFTFKVIGDSRSDFASEALNSTLLALGETREINHSCRTSSAGKHTAITISVYLKSANEVHAVYRNLLEIKDVRALF